MNDIYVGMSVPQLGDPGFSGQFNDFCNAIIQNIQRLMSVQYSKGAKGDSVITNGYTINYDTPNPPSPNGIGDMGAALLNTLFSLTGSDALRIDSTAHDVYQMFNGTDPATAPMTVGGFTFDTIGKAPYIIVDGVEYNAMPDIIGWDRGGGHEVPCDGIHVDITIDQENHMAWLSSPLIIIDGRIAALNQLARVHDDMLEYYKMFHDISTAVYGSAIYDSSDPDQDPTDPLTWTWTMEMVNIVPKLYYDTKVKEFCWEVNGQQTGVTAQGIKGDTGTSSATWICIGDRDASNPAIINLKKYQVVDSLGRASFIEVDASSPIKDGDMVLVFWPEMATPGLPNVFESAFFGCVYIDSNNAPYTVIGEDSSRRADVFESIRQRSNWNIMVTIGEPAMGSPRGYILPADPVIGLWPNTQGVQGHMAYTERTGASCQDAHGYGVLHLAPVDLTTQGAIDPSDDPNYNPTTDHIGDMVVDYNIKNTGNMMVQGTAVFNGNTTINANLNVNNHYITAQGVKAIGDIFPTVIGDTKLACMSRFKDVKYSVRRTPTLQDASDNLRGNLAYDIAVGGVLELNVGLISNYDEQRITQGHHVLNDYTENWKDGQPNERNQCSNYSQGNHRQRSKLYDVITYNIPFNITRGISQRLEVTGTSDKNTGTNNIFGFTTQGSSADHKISTLRMANNGVNDKRIHYRIGATKARSISGFDINPLPDRGKAWSDDISHNQSGGVGDPAYILLHWFNASSDNIMNRGALQGLLDSAFPGGSNDVYALTGDILYKSSNGYTIPIQYYFDLYTSLIESDVVSFTSGNQDFKDLDFAINITITPVGYLKYNGSYYAPIWNAINTLNSTTINDINLYSGFKVKDNGYVIQTYNFTTLNPLIHDNLSYVYTQGTTGVDQKYYLQFTLQQAEYELGSGYMQGTQSSNIITTCSVGNPHISLGDPTPIFGGFLQGTAQLQGFYHNENNINGPSGIIMSGSNMMTGYMLSVFDKVNNDMVYTGQTVSYGYSRYDQIMPIMMLVDRNPKIWPNNQTEGYWVQSAGAAAWYSIQEVPVCMFPCGQYVGDRRVSAHYSSCPKIGFSSLWVDNDKLPVSMQGMLTYPNTPCVISGAPGQYWEVEDMYNDTSSGGEHYVVSGRPLGLDDGKVHGIATINMDDTIATTTFTSSSDPINDPVPIIP